MRIAKATHSSVLTTTAKSTKTDDAKSGELTRVSPSGQDTEFAQNAPAQAPTGRSQRGELETPPAQVADASRNTPVATTGQAAERPRRRLPQTGSEMPTVLLLGLGFLSSAAAMGFGRFDRF